LEGQLAAPLDNLNDSLIPLLRQLLDEGMLSDSSVAAAKETIRIVAGKVGRARTSQMPFPIARHHKFKAEVMDSFAKTVDEIRTLDDLLENTVLGNPGLGTGLRMQAHEMGKRYKSALHRAQNLQGKGPVQFWGKGVYDLWMEPWSSAVAARGAGSVPPTVTNARKGGVFYHGRQSGHARSAMADSMMEAGVLPESNVATFRGGSGRRLRGGPGSERLEPRVGLHVGSKRAAEDRLAIEGAGLGMARGGYGKGIPYQTPIFEVEVIPRNPYLPNGKVISEAGVRGAEGTGLTPTQIRQYLDDQMYQDELVQQGYDVIPYLNTVEDPGSLSYVILDPASVRISKIPEWGRQTEGFMDPRAAWAYKRGVTRDLGLPPTVEARRKILNLGEALENWRFAQQRRDVESQLIDDMVAKGEATQQRIDALYGKLPDEEIRALPGKQRISVEDPVYTRTTKAGKVLPARRRVEATPEGVERADWKRPGMNVRAMERSLEIREQNVAQVHLSIEKMRLTKETVEAELGMNSIATGDARSAIINELSQKEAMGLYDLGKFGGEGARLGDLHGDELFNLLDEGIHKWGPWMISKGGPEWNESVTDVMMASMNLNRDNLKGFVNGYDRLHNWIKANLIATPGFVMRNVMGGAFNMWFDGIPPIEVLNALKLTVKANNLGRGDMAVGAQRLIDSMEGRTVGVYGTRFTRSELDNFKVLTEAGAVHGGQAASAIEQAIIRRSRLSVTARLDAGAEGAEAVGTPITFDPRNADFFFFRAVREANTIAEESLRMGTGLFAMREGADVARSIQRIYKLHFDYSDLSDWELKWGKRVFPFYTWSRNNLPLQVEFLARNPAKYNRLFDLKRNLEWGEEKEAEGYVPDYFLEPFGVQLPFKIGDSKTYSTPDWPFQDLFRIDPSAKGWEAASNLMSGASPILKAPLEYWAGKRVFGNIPFTGRFQQVPNGFGAIPLLLPALGAAGMAKKDRAGDWVMTDKNIALVGDTLPFLNLARRAWPNEEKYQDKVVQIWVSLLGGSSLRVLTDREKWTQQIRRQMEYYKDRRDRRDIEYRRV
jgi:hypothetical protein